MDELERIRQIRGELASLRDEADAVLGTLYAEIRQACQKHRQRTVAEAAGLSYQRISQIVHETGESQ